MKYLTVFISTFFIGMNSIYCQVEDVKKKSEVQFVNNDSICYLNGNLYTGEVVDFFGQRFDKTKMLFDGHFKDGQRNGPFKKWYPNFKIEAIENYKMGLKDGVQAYFYNSGNKKAEYKYINGVPDGIWTEWHDNKQIKTTCTYVMGSMLDGTYITFLPDGHKESEVTYKNGKITTSGRYEGDKFIVVQELSSEKYPNGQLKSEGTIVSGKKEGIWTTWYESGQKESEETYKNGIQNGISLSWYINGTKEHEGIYDFGRKNGKWISYHENGQIDSSGYYINGLKDGQWTSWHKNQQKKSDGYYKEGKKDGSWHTWFENGRIEFNGNYKDDYIDGNATLYYSADGTEVYQGDWKMGKRDGYGKYSLNQPNGDTFTYTGYFANDQYEGQGKIFRSEGKGNRQTSSTYCCEFRNGKIYNGTCRNNLLDGQITEYKIVNGKWGPMQMIDWGRNSGPH